MTGFYSAVVTKLIKNFKSLYGFGGHCLKVRESDVCMDFEPCFKVHNVVSVSPKSIILHTEQDLSCGGASLLIG